tara:strand:- start:148 stop:279 length:132 start_codon:yes stop_codon:yes gene_type:complete
LIHIGIGIRIVRGTGTGICIVVRIYVGVITGVGIRIIRGTCII